VESAGIADLALARNRDQVRAVEHISDRVDSGGGRRVAVGGSRSALSDRAVLSVSQVLVHIKAASNRLEVRIDKFTNHDLLQRVCVWFGICEQHWLEANQCLTARVDA
jgi:hypothetical protein